MSDSTHEGCRAITEFKAKCNSLLRDVQSSGEPLLVTRRGQPMVRIEPLRQAPRHGRRLGLLKGRLEFHGDLVEASSTDDWEMLD